MNTKTQSITDLSPEARFMAITIKALFKAGVDRIPDPYRERKTVIIILRSILEVIGITESDIGLDFDKFTEDDGKKLISYLDNLSGDGGQISEYQMCCLHIHAIGEEIVPDPRLSPHAEKISEIAVRMKGITNNSIIP